MAANSTVRLSRLREIGWRLWDPIGLAELEGASRWEVADEYDQYLLHVADMVRAGASVDEAAAYLVDIASEHMGLSYVDPRAAAATARAIADHIPSLPD